MYAYAVKKLSLLAPLNPLPDSEERVYLASEVDAEIAKLKEALIFYADAKQFYVWDRDDKYHDNGNEIARIALGL